MNAVKTIGVMISLSLLAGCATPSKQLYYWGDYNVVVYDMYANPGEADAATQVEKLTRTIQQAESSGLNVPPGLYAHLGMAYSQLGNQTLAIEALQQEKTAYPESAKFIDGMLERTQQGGK